MNKHITHLLAGASLVVLVSLGSTSPAHAVCDATCVSAVTTKIVDKAQGALEGFVKGQIDSMTDAVTNVEKLISDSERQDRVKEIEAQKAIKDAEMQIIWQQERAKLQAQAAILTAPQVISAAQCASLKRAQAVTTAGITIQENRNVVSRAGFAASRGGAGTPSVQGQVAIVAENVKKSLDYDKKAASDRLKNANVRPVALAGLQAPEAPKPVAVDPADPTSVDLSEFGVLTNSTEVTASSVDYLRNAIDPFPPRDLTEKELADPKNQAIKASLDSRLAKIEQANVLPNFNLSLRSAALALPAIQGRPARTGSWMEGMAQEMSYRFKKGAEWHAEAFKTEKSGLAEIGQMLATIMYLDMVRFYREEQQSNTLSFILAHMAAKEMPAAPVPAK